jgi:DNA replication protein DnaC
MIESFDYEKHFDLCPTCGSSYSYATCKREDWKNETCNCYEQNKLWKEYTFSGIPNDYFSKDISDYEFKTDATGDKYYNDILKYCKYLHQVLLSGSCLFLHNELTSTGKTFFAISILKEAYRLDYSIQFLPFLKIQNELLSNRDVEKFLKNANKKDFLVIDSVDREIKKDFLSDIKVLNFFEEFLKNRFKPIIFTSSSPLNNTNLHLLNVIKSVLKSRIYEIFIDSPRQYLDHHNYWNNIVDSKRERLK